MATQKFANLASTTLTANYTAGDTSITVAASGGNFPSSAQFHIFIADASTGAVKVILKVTAIPDSTHFTTTPEGTDANASSGDVVKLSLTAGTFDQFRQDIHLTGSYASAASRKAGDLYMPNDALVIARDSGSAFVPWGPIWPLSDPALQTWTQTNFSGASQDSTHGGVGIINTQAENSFQIRSLTKNAPSTPYHCEFGFLMTMGNVSGNVMHGCCFFDGTKYEIASMRFQGGLQFVTFYCSNGTTYGGSTPVNTTSWMTAGPILWMRIGDDGTTNKTWDISADGYNWHQVGSEARTTNLTATKVGFYVNGGPSYLRCIHYKETA